MMQEVIDLQNEHHETHQYMESINEKLKEAERKQKQMISFLGQVLQNQTFSSSIREKKEGMLHVSSSSRATNMFIEHQPLEQNPDLEFVMTEDDHVSKGKNVLEIEDDAQKSIFEASYGGTNDEILVKQEDVWSDLQNCEFSDLWDLGTNWQSDDDIRFDEIDKQDDSSKKTDA
ncbi:uncharacterized protein [Rutidosis leptorrhynchoides]|uniref:uncharacterized protein n=1 Tax=Rutidosis leptorrhynchoides TaxID=125765 RepID=UPI003A997764